jgi:hypothetical protein
MNKKTVLWHSVSGQAKGLRRYTQTDTLPGWQNVPETTYTQQVTEFWIKDSTGKETPVVVPWDLMLAEGQRVSAVHGGIEGSSKSAWLVLVNHDARSSHYLERPRAFLHKAGLMRLVPRWVFFVLLGAGLAASFFTALGTASLWPWPALCLAPALLVGLFDVWQSRQVRRAWKAVEAVVPGMVKTLSGDHQ